MKRSHLITLGVLLVLAVGLFLAALALRGTDTYEAQGRIAGFSTDGRTVFIEHEAISGYMAAMTMPFVVRDTAALEGLAVGDAVAFRLHVTRGSSWISGLREVSDAAVPVHPAAASRSRLTTPDSTRLLMEGDRVPTDLTLTGQDGEPLSFGDYRGQALLLTFIYTRCPLPNFCPLMSRRFATLQPKLRDAFGERVQLLSISFDPAYDTPKVLRDYAARYTDDLSTWTFATGTPEQVGRVTGLFGVFTRKEGGQIIHNLTTVLVGPQGRIREIWRGNDWTTEEVMQATHHALSGGTP